MRLIPVGLRGRRFLIQYLEVLGEFGQAIPWLRGLGALTYATNGRYFADELRSRTEQGNGQIVPYQFVLGDNARTYSGGVISFAKSPERFTDQKNASCQERLAANGFGFVSCLQVRAPMRHLGIGSVMWRKAINAILHDHGPFWGVVSNPTLIPWYLSLGGRLWSRADNEDNLWIISWQKTVSTGEC